MSNQEVLVTGCAGFIGNAVAKRLLDEGHSVVGVDEMNDAYDVRLKEHRLEGIRNHPEFTFHQDDICDQARMTQLFGSHAFGRVYHLAARAGVRQSVSHPELYTRANVDGTLSLLEASRRHDVGRFLMASTSSLYGAHNKTPFSEDADTSRPLSPYAASKKGAEALCASYTHLHGIHTIIPRYFTVYGPAGRPDMSAFRFIKWILQDTPITVYGDGTQERDFTYIDDIARGTLLAAEHLDGHQIVNLGNDQPAPLNHLIELIEAAVGKRAKRIEKPMHRADVMATWANISKARGFGWAPEVSLEEGVRRTVAWFHQHQHQMQDVMIESV